MVKNIILVVLVIAVLGLAYMLFVDFPKRAEAECRTRAEAECKAQIENTVIPQAEAACMEATTQLVASAQQCGQTLQQLMQVPACAAVLQQQ